MHKLIHVLVALVLSFRTIQGDLIPNGHDGITAVDSDFLLLYKSDSKLPVASAGQGVFAKYNIPAKSILCEHRGPVIETKDFHKVFEDDKTFSFHGPDGKDYELLANNICAFANDCTAATQEPLSDDDLLSLNKNITPGLGGISCIDGFQYNSKSIISDSGKVFIVSTREILKDEEIFFSYGWYDQ